MWQKAQEAKSHFTTCLLPPLPASFDSAQVLCPRKCIKLKDSQEKSKSCNQFSSAATTQRLRNVIIHIIHPAIEQGNNSKTTFKRYEHLEKGVETSKVQLNMLRRALAPQGLENISMTKGCGRCAKECQ
jgi:hypothetical protein